MGELPAYTVTRVPDADGRNVPTVSRVKHRATGYPRRSGDIGRSGMFAQNGRAQTVEGLWIQAADLRIRLWYVAAAGLEPMS